MDFSRALDRRPESVAPWLPSKTQLYFPAHRSAGVVLVKDESGKWVDHAPAFATADVPAARPLGLRWDASMPFDAGWVFCFPLDRLAMLDLEWSDVSDDTFPALHAFPFLEELRLGHTRITDAAFGVVGKLKALRSLSVRGTSVGDSAVAALMQCVNLESVDMAATRVTAEGVKALGRLPKLSALDLSANHWPRIHAHAVHALARAHALRTLSLAWTDLGDIHLEGLAAIRGLEVLDLSGTCISDEGLRAVAKLPLRRLTLIACHGITNRSMETLAGIETLATLHINGTGIDNLGVFELWDKRPGFAVNGLTFDAWQAGALAGRWSAGEAIVG
jgi:hypothetical protein